MRKLQRHQQRNFRAKKWMEIGAFLKKTLAKFDQKVMWLMLCRENCAIVKNLKMIWKWNSITPSSKASVNKEVKTREPFWVTRVSGQIPNRGWKTNMIGIDIRGTLAALNKPRTGHSQTNCEDWLSTLLLSLTHPQ